MNIASFIPTAVNSAKEVFSNVIGSQKTVDSVNSYNSEINKTFDSERKIIENSSELSDIEKITYLKNLEERQENVYSNGIEQLAKDKQNNCNLFLQILCPLLYIQSKAESLYLSNQEQMLSCINIREE